MLNLVTIESSKMNRRNFLKASAAGSGALALSACDPPTGPLAEKRNVVMICVDDMNDYPGFMGGYAGDSETPHMDDMSASSLYFKNAHCVVPVCMPSRAAVMFSKSPEETGIYGHDGFINYGEGTSFRRYQDMLNDPSVLSLPQMLSAYGDIVTFSTGKVFHDSEPSQWDFEKKYESLNSFYNRSEGQIDGFKYGVMPEGEIHPDQASASWASNVLGGLLEQQTFLSIGLFQPHVPWNVPQWAYDLHPLDNVVVPELRSDDLDDLSDAGKAMANSPYISEGQPNYDLMVDVGTQAKVVQAYLAAMSHTDAMIGQILEAIDSGPNAGNTDVILWSDHGYHLGEKLHVRKATMWEQATRVPLLIRTPGLSGEVTQPASLQDIATTVMDMMGLDSEAIAESEGLDGHSLLQQGRTEARTYWSGGSSLRSERYRYIRYSDGSEELYDHDSDPHEYTNMANHPASQNIVQYFRGLDPNT